MVIKTAPEVQRTPKKSNWQKLHGLVKNITKRLDHEMRKHDEGIYSFADLAMFHYPNFDAMSNATQRSAIKDVVKLKIQVVAALRERYGLYATPINQTALDKKKGIRKNPPANNIEANKFVRFGRELRDSGLHISTKPNGYIALSRCENLASMGAGKIEKQFQLVNEMQDKNLLSPDCTSPLLASPQSNDKVVFSNWLTAACVVKKLTGGQLAQKAGISRAAAYFYLEGQRVPNPEALGKVAAALEIDPSTIPMFASKNEGVILQGN